MNRWSEEQTGGEKSRPERRGVAGIIGKRRLRGGEAVWGEQEKVQRGEESCREMFLIS